MRRALLIILFLVVLATPFALRVGLGWNVREKRGDDANTVVILTPHAESIKQEFAIAFAQWHREKFSQLASVDYRAMSTQDIIKYLAAGKETLYAKLGTYNVDLIWGGGDYLYDVDLKTRLDVLEPLKLDDAVMTAAFPQPELGGLLFTIEPIPRAGSARH
jgi:hypothetical protein